LRMVKEEITCLVNYKDWVHNSFSFECEIKPD
jgi:hypothetical protein